jgi:hypothetical protein
MPSGATIDPATGVFRWTAMIDPNYFVGAATLYGPAVRTGELQKAVADSELGISTRPDHPAKGGREIDIVFWVQDARGQSDFALVRYFLRDPGLTARCKAHESAKDRLNTVNQQGRSAASTINKQAKPVQDATHTGPVDWIDVGATCVTPS